MDTNRGRETRTRWDTIFDHIHNRGIETPITLPVRHSFTGLEVLGKMVNTDGPGVHDDTAETASGTNLGRCHLPLLHRPARELDSVDELEVLTQMVLPVEGAFSQRPLLARRVVVTLDMCFIGICLPAKDTGYLPILRVERTRAVRGAHPPLE